MDGPVDGITLRLDLDDGRVMVIRDTSEADAPQLMTLYDQLPDDDRRRRFFGSFQPDEAWFRHWSSVREQGGFGTIAVVHQLDGDDVVEPPIEVAGEAAYTMRDDGDGELAIVVAPRWRGLGTLLLDVLCEHAATRGIESLQADVLSKNTSMMMALRKRGLAVLEHDDGAVRVTVGTAADAPAWPPADTRPRLLVEIPGARWAGERAAERAGWSVALCPGPQARTHQTCPALCGDGCGLVEGADAIVVALDPSDERTADLAEHHRREHPDAQVLVHCDHHQVLDELTRIR